MTRRKKLLKLGLKPEKVKSKEERKYEEMLSGIKKKVQKRKQDKKQQEQLAQEWRENYSKNFPKTNTEPKEGWSNGTCAKRSIFEPVRLDKMDLEEINAKRKENNINTPIEQAVEEAMIEIKRKATMVAPAYSKGAYQFLGNNKQNIRDAGKKNSEME